MADQASKDAAAQQRIVSHMQKDHHDSIVRYLEHYSKVSAWTAQSGVLTAVDLNGMTLTASGKTHRIPFDPPLKSYSEARERVVSIDQDCLRGLGRSDITINEFIWPTGRYGVEFAVILGIFAAYSQRWWFAPGSIVERSLGVGLAKFSYRIQPWLFGGLLVVHAAELAYFVPARLRKHSVNPRTGLFWLWCAAQAIMGIGCSKRFDALVEKKRVAKGKQQH
nr:hypothetical protein B0A51_03216 [Rachicladosporium sp. CCFEE 5018]